MNKIQEILKLWRIYDNLRIRISTISKSYELHLSMEMLPHLLGLHYGTSKNIKGYRLYKFFEDKGDEEIYENIRNHNKDKVYSVKNRINYFEYFMRNLEKAELYENVHPDTKIKSTFFMVEIERGKYLQLGIVENEYMDYMETFIVRDDDKYIKTSPIKEQVTAIERYENDKLVPFSFDEEKNEKLLAEYHAFQDADQKLEQQPHKDSTVNKKNINLKDRLKIATERANKANKNLVEKHKSKNLER